MLLFLVCIKYQMYYQIIATTFACTFSRLYFFKIICSYTGKIVCLSSLSDSKIIFWFYDIHIIWYLKNNTVYWDFELRRNWVIIISSITRHRDKLLEWIYSLSPWYGCLAKSLREWKIVRGKNGISFWSLHVIFFHVFLSFWCHSDQ